MNKINIYYIGCIICMILVASSIAYSGEKAVWMEGTVTRLPEKINNSYYLQIDGNLFRITNEATVRERVERETGVFDEKAGSINTITKNRKILIKVKYEDIYQIILL